MSININTLCVAIYFIYLFIYLYIPLKQLLSLFFMIKSAAPLSFTELYSEFQLAHNFTVLVPSHDLIATVWHSRQSTNCDYINFIVCLHPKSYQVQIHCVFK